MSEVELVEFAVDRYKNLQDVRIEWASRQVLFGANGVGKTNLLEAMALCFGSDATMWQLARRAHVPEPGSLSAVIRATPMQLPLPPTYVLPPESVAKIAELDPVPRVLEAFLQATYFWPLLGGDGDRSASWEEAMRSLLPDEVGRILAETGRRPLIRVELESLTGLEEARRSDARNHVEDGYYPDLADVLFRRTFRRTLVLDGEVPDALVRAAGKLPDAFAPLRQWLDRSELERGRYVDLLALPDADWVPVKAVWLASERSAAEAFYDLYQAQESALPAAAALQEQLDRLNFWPDPGDDKETKARARRAEYTASFMLCAQATEAATATVQRVFPDLSVGVGDDSLASITVYRGEHTAEASLSKAELFHVFSSGERTWLDFGLAHGAAAIDRGAARAAWIAVGLSRLADEGLLEAAVDLEDAIYDMTSTPSASEKATVYFERLFGSPLQVLVGPLASEASDAHLSAVMAATSEPTLLAAFTPVREIHLYDEPERHLHPAAQRRAAESFSRPSLEDVVLATHSHLFLGSSQWRHHHIDRTPEGVVITPFNPAELDKNLAVTRQLGLGRGELLSRIRYLLVVEGLIDRIVLTGLYGDVLADAGVLVLPMHGVDEVLSLTEFELFGSLVDVGAGVLVDNAADVEKTETKEGEALRGLKHRLRQRGRSMDYYGLRHADILAYLHEDALRHAFPNFPGWDQIDDAYARKRIKFKDALMEAVDDRLGRKRVRELVEHMHHDGLPARDDLPHVVAEIVEVAGRTADST